MPSYAYLVISPNTANDDTWYSSHAHPVFHYIKIGHTSTAESGRQKIYNTYNPLIYTRMLSFADPLSTDVKNIEIGHRRPEVPKNIANVPKDSSTALFLQRYCLEGSFDRGGLAKEWFIIPGSMERVIALIWKLDQDADAENLPRQFDHEGEFCQLFLDIVFR